MRQKNQFTFCFVCFFLWLPCRNTASPLLFFPYIWMVLHMLLVFLFFKTNNLDSVPIIPSQYSCLRLFTIHFYLLRLPGLLCIASSYTSEFIWITFLTLVLSQGPPPSLRTRHTLFTLFQAVDTSFPSSWKTLDLLRACLSLDLLLSARMPHAYLRLFENVPFCICVNPAKN